MAPAKGLQRVPSTQRTNIPDTGRICPVNGLGSRLQIDFFSFILDYYLVDVSDQRGMIYSDDNPDSTEQRLLALLHHC